MTKALCDRSLEPEYISFGLVKPVHLFHKLSWEIVQLEQHLQKPMPIEPLGFPLAAYMAFNVAVTAYHLCEWVWGSWSEEERKKFFKTEEPKCLPKKQDEEFRRAMMKSCKALKVCQQLANSSKHLNYRSRDPSIKFKNNPYARFRESPLQSKPVLISLGYNMLIHDGTKSRQAIDVFREVHTFWEQKFVTWGLIEANKEFKD